LTEGKSTSSLSIEVRHSLSAVCSDGYYSLISVI